jgi:hypothetical protein
MGEQALVLSDEQRIELLENRATKNLYVIISMAGVLLLLLSLLISGFVMIGLRMSNIDDGLKTNSDHQEITTGLQSEVTSHREHLLTFNQILATYDINQQAGAMAQIIALEAQREKDLKTFLGTMQHAIISLSRMIPGSRAWHEDFNNEIEKIKFRSGKRLQKLNEMKETTPDKIPDLPIEE